MNIEQTLMERAKYWYPRVWQREMWQNMLLRVQQNICYESFCEQNICKSDSLCPSLLIYEFMFIFMFYDEWQVVQWCVVLESGVSVSIVPCSDPLFHITDQTCNILCSMFDDV